MLFNHVSVRLSRFEQLLHHDNRAVRPFARFRSSDSTYFVDPKFLLTHLEPQPCLQQLHFRSARLSKDPVPQRPRSFPLIHNHRDPDPYVHYTCSRVTHDITPDIFVGGRLSSYAQYWLFIFNLPLHPWLLQVLQNGFRINFLSKPPSMSRPRY